MTKWAKRACELVDQIEWYRDVKFRFPTLSCGCDLMISRLDRKLTRVLKPHLTEVVILGEISDSDIAVAKQAPIAALFPDAKGYMVKCLWHDDSRPSASIKKGYFVCFTCGEKADVIKCYQKIHGVGFVDAVKALR